jgi:hypothetical protein
MASSARTTVDFPLEPAIAITGIEPLRRTIARQASKDDGTITAA